MQNYAEVLQVCFERYERVIAVSDLHGDCVGFDAMLQYAGFSRNDALVIVGDILERGRQSLKLLSRVMDLAETSGRVFMVRGNNDTILTRFAAGQIPDEHMLGYMKSRESSVISEMAEQLNLPWNDENDVARLRARISDRYAKEIAFIKQLPHIIDSERAVFVHAGIKPGRLDLQDASYCLTAEAFAQTEYRFDKPVVVGHWPTGNYCTKALDVGIYHNREGNIYSIDGGNSMKAWGQINMLVMTADGQISFDAYDPCRRIQVLEDQCSEAEAVTLTFPNTRLSILEMEEDKARCFVPYLNRDMLFDPRRIYEYKGNTYAGDFTTYFLPVQAGEIVSYCGECDEGILIKKRSIVGKYRGRYAFMQP